MEKDEDERSWWNKVGLRGRRGAIGNIMTIISVDVVGPSRWTINGISFTLSNDGG
ncbi:7794_t:CDS:1, partial [Paraglomus occultum]